MFRHNEYVSKMDYPFNAGYVVYANYFFPASSITGEDSDVPMKEFPKAFQQNFEYYVDNELDEDERAVIYKSFREKKAFSKVAEEMGLSVRDLTVLRTKAFSKLRSVVRTRNVLSDVPFTPKQEKRSNVTIGNIHVDSVMKSPDSSTGGGEYRLITVKSGKIPVFSMRLSTKTNNITDEELHDLLVDIAKLAGKIKLE